MKKVLFIFGTAKLAYKIVEDVNPGTVVIVFSTQNFSETQVYDFDYVDMEKSYDRKRHKIVSDAEFCDGSLDFTEPGIDVYIMNIFTHRRLLEIQEEFYAISCCRSGLTETYVPLINELSCHGVIVSFDNDKSIAQAANELSCNCDVYAGVAHCHVPYSVQWNKAKTKATIIADKYGYLVFPPKCPRYHRLLNSSISSPLSITYTDDEEDFQRAVYEKLVNVNILHTFICFEVKKIFTDNYGSMTLADITEEDFNALCAHVLSLHKQMYLSCFKDDDQYVLGARVAESFLRNLRAYKESCTRGVDFNSQSSLLKAKRHLNEAQKLGINTEEYLSLLDSN